MACWRLPVAVVGGALHAHLELPSQPARRVPHLDRLLDGEGHWLLAVDVFARLHRVDRDLRVPVVRRGDDHGIDVLPLEELPVVLEGFALADGGIGPGPLSKDIADRRQPDVSRLHLDELPDVAAPHAASADHRKDDPVTRSLLLDGGGLPRNDAERQRARGGLAEELAAGDHVIHVHCEPSFRPGVGIEWRELDSEGYS